MKPLRRHSLSVGLAATLFASAVFAQSSPQDVAILFASPVVSTVILGNPNNFPYQVYAPQTGAITIDGGILTLTNGAFVRYGGTITNNGTLVLGRDSSSGLIGSIAFLGNGSPISFATGSAGGGGVLRMLGGSIYTSFNYFFPGADTGRLINGPGHLITNDDGAASGPAYAGSIGSLQLTNQGDIFSVRSGGVLNLSLNALGNFGGAGQHINSPTGRIAAYDSGRINISVRGAGGFTNAPNAFINDGLITTVQPGAVGPQTGGGTIRLSSLVSLINPASPPGSFEGNNPEITAGGRLELSEIRFINTLPPATPGGPRIGKTLSPTNGTISVDRYVTIEGGRIVGGTTPSQRFEIGSGLLENSFLDVEFSGTFFGRGYLRLLGGTDISAADFRQLTDGNYPLILNLGADQLFSAVRNYQGDIRFASDASVTRRTLTLNGDLYGDGSLGFANLTLAGGGDVYTPVIRIGPDLNLAGYSGVLRPNRGIPTGGGQLRLEGISLTAPLSPKLSYSNSTLVLDRSNYDLGGSTLAPASTSSSLRLENNATLRNGTLNAIGADVTVASSRLEQLTLTGGTIRVESAITLDRVLPGNASEFIGTDYTVTLGAASLSTPWDLVGGTLRFNTTSGGTVSLNTALANQDLPTGGAIAADRIRLIGNLSGYLPFAQFAAGPSGSLHLILGANSYYTPTGGAPIAGTAIGGLNVAGGDLRLDYAAPSYFFPAEAEAYLFNSTSIAVDGRLTIASALTLRPNAAYYDSITGATLPSALSARAFSFENNSISGLHLRPYASGGVATVDLAFGATTLLAAANTTTYLNGGTLVIGDPTFSFDPLNQVMPTTIALVAPPGTGISTPGQVSSDGTLVFSGVALSGYVSESVTPSGFPYMPRILPDQSQLGTITAQNITLRNGTLVGTRYESFQDLGSGDQIRRWTQAPNLSAMGDPNLGTPGILRLETGRYALESNLRYDQLMIGTGATLTRRSNLTPGYFSFIGDSLATDPDLAPLADTPAVLEVRAPNGFYQNRPYDLVLDGGRIEALTLASLPAPYSYGTGRSGVLVLSRATFTGDSSLIGTLDHASGAVTRFEGGYTFALGALDSNGEYQPQLLRPAPGLTGADRRFAVEIAAVGSAPATVTLAAAALAEQSTLLQGNVTVTGVAGPSNTPARLALLSNGTNYQDVANLRHSEGTLTFAGDLHVNVNGLLESADRIVFAAGMQLSGSGTVRASTIGLNGQTLPGNSPGTLTFEGDVTFGDTHELILDIGFAPWDSDRIVVRGHLAVAGKLTLNFVNGYNPLGTNSYFSAAFPLVSASTFSGSFTSFGVEGIDPALFDESQFAQILSTELITAVPEPSAYAMFMAGAVLLAAVAVRRRRLEPARRNESLSTC